MPLRFLTAGESHGPALTTILDGMPAGLPLSAEIINKELARRQKGYGSGGRMKIERDTVQILGGVMAGETTGAPIALLVENADHVKWKGKAIEPMTAPRPGHADLTGAVKYGFKDLRPALERASARETTMRVAVGAICKQFLAQNTLGGVLEIVALNTPVGLGSFAQWDKRLEAKLAMAILSVQAIKGVEVGDAFANARLPGTQVHDPITLERSNVQRSTNRAGGTEGGVSNGQPIVVRAAMKPIATTLLPQPTVDLASGTESPTRYERSDFCPVPRAVPILEAMVAFVLADELIEKLGGDSINEMKPRFESLRKARLKDLQMDNTPHVFWE